MSPLCEDEGGLGSAPGGPDQQSLWFSTLILPIRVQTQNLPKPRAP